jgi:hypothetical protein
MKPDPILQEVWDIKERLAAEAGYDVERFFEQLQQWSETHPHSGPVIRSAEELRELVKQREAASPALSEQPPKYGGK